MLGDLSQSLHSFVVPDSNSCVGTSGSNQTQVVSIVTASDVSFVSVGSTSKDVSCTISVLGALVEMDLNGSIPGNRDNCLIILSVAKERNFTIDLVIVGVLRLRELTTIFIMQTLSFGIVPIKLVGLHSRC